MDTRKDSRRVNRDELSRRVLSSTLWSIGASSGGQIFGFLVFVQIARQVGPDGFGLVALAALLIDIMQIVSTGGVYDAVIQRPELSEKDADTAFWANYVSGIVFFLVALAVSRPLAWAFQTPDLAWVIQILSATFLIAPLGAIHSARLARTLGFRSLAIRSLGANLVSGAVALAVVNAGGGVIALIVQRILSVVTMTVISWLCFRWLPRCRFDQATFRQLMHYGLRAMGAQLLSQMSTRTVEMTAGFALGPAAVGMVRVANRCVEMIIQITVVPFQQVALPALSRSRGNLEARQNAYTHLGRLSSLLVFPAFGGAFALAPIILPLAFGVQWSGAAHLMQIILLTAVALQCSVMIPAAIGATGYPGQVLGWSLSQLVAGIVLCAAGSLFGAAGVVTANVARAYLMLPYGLWLLRRKTGVGVRVVFGTIVRPLGVAVAMTLAVLLVQAELQPVLSPIPLLAACIVAGAIFYAVGILIFMRDMVGEVANILPLRARRWLRLPA
jgi:O-antigen/teichoic acid export membrane protein